MRISGFDFLFLKKNKLINWFRSVLRPISTNHQTKESFWILTLKARSQKQQPKVKATTDYKFKANQRTRITCTGAEFAHQRWDFANASKKRREIPLGRWIQRSLQVVRSSTGLLLTGQLLLEEGKMFRLNFVIVAAASYAYAKMKFVDDYSSEIIYSWHF